MAKMEDVVLKEVANKILPKLDTDKLAKKLAPILSKQIEKHMLSYFDRDTISSAIEDSNIYSHLSTYLENSLKKTLGIKSKKKGQ